MNIGDTVYLRPVGNNARNGNKEIRKAEIAKVGRKYFEVSIGRNRNIKFRLEDNEQENGGYIADWQLYRSEQEVAEEDECNDTLRLIRSVFAPYGKHRLTLNQLRDIRSVIERPTGHRFDRIGASR